MRLLPLGANWSGPLDQDAGHCWGLRDAVFTSLFLFWRRAGSSSLTPMPAHLANALARGMLLLPPQAWSKPLPCGTQRRRPFPLAPYSGRALRARCDEHALTPARFAQVEHFSSSSVVISILVDCPLCQLPSAASLFGAVSRFEEVLAGTVVSVARDSCAVWSDARAGCVRKAHTWGTAGENCSSRGRALVLLLNGERDSPDPRGCCRTRTCLRSGRE